LKGKYLVAIPWPEPYVSNQLGVEYFNEANRFSFLSGAVSSPSDENGIVIF
jgi:hypothetical protein